MKKNIYLNIYNEYAELIQTGSLEPGTKLPSESELAEQYGTTRETVRKALNLLSQNGYIHKMMGKGSFVLDIGRMNFPITGLISFKEMSEKIGRPTRTIVEQTAQIEAPKDIAYFLQIPTQAPVWEVIRVREIEEERVILDKDYLLPEAVQTMTAEIAAESIYDYVEQTLGLVISYAKKEISVEEATEEDRRLMDLKGLSHVVVVRNFVYLEDTTLFQYTESRHRLDKFQFVDFARRIR
ncbi:trehalose operon repressor [Paenibacillus zeisoli]|uniref:Trehalose operon repressor n=1 Tax=Paenibacillus zeisoli TaxID=2496267 RepID=A0A433XND6_9BACL|nr:trehalose operon repressor [Paenibacillus zeisoli]RUT35564.1 trehalose operon repressor [Paenibacillus zeisoli]